MREDFLGPPVPEANAALNSTVGAMFRSTAVDRVRATVTVFCPVSLNENRNVRFSYPGRTHDDLPGPAGNRTDCGITGLLLLVTSAAPKSDRRPGYGRA